MSTNIVEWIKEHPWEVGGGIFTVGAGIVLISKLKSGGTAVPTASYANNTAAYLQYQEQQSTLAAQQSAQQSQDQMALQGAQLSATVEEDQLQAELDATTNTNQTQEDINSQNVGGTVQVTSLNDQTSVANTQAITGAQVTTALGADSANVSVAQANAAMLSQEAMYQEEAVSNEASALEGGVEAQAKASQTSSMFGALASLF